MSDVWKVIETPCFPNAWKVVSSEYQHNNAGYLYHPTKEEAQKQADEFNKTHNEKLKNGEII